MRHDGIYDDGMRQPAQKLDSRELFGCVRKDLDINHRRSLAAAPAVGAEEADAVRDEDRVVAPRARPDRPRHAFPE
jgi:hypothetical protein